MSEVALSRLVSIDQTCDYIPIISTVTNLVDIFEKCVLSYCCNPSHNKNYFTYIQNKSFLRCIALLIPIVGNIFVAMYDDYNKKESLDEGVTYYTKNGYKDRLKSLDKTLFLTEARLYAAQGGVKNALTMNLQDILSNLEQVSKKDLDAIVNEKIEAIIVEIKTRLQNGDDTGP